MKTPSRWFTLLITCERATQPGQDYGLTPAEAAEEAHRAELRAALEATLGCTLAEAAAKIEAALRTPNRNV